MGSISWLISDGSMKWIASPEKKMINPLIITKLLVIFIMTLVAGCASDVYISADSPVLKNQNVSKTIAVYRIGVDDTVQINVWRNQELSVTVPVRPDGKISMPLIGDVRAAGYTPEEVAEAIRKRLQNYVRDPNVTLMVTGLLSNEYLTRLRVTGDQ